MVPLQTSLALSSGIPDQGLLEHIKAIAVEVSEQRSFANGESDELEEEHYDLAGWLHSQPSRFLLLRSALMQRVQEQLMALRPLGELIVDGWQWPQVLTITGLTEQAMLAAILPFFRNPLEIEEPHVTSIVNGIRIAGPFQPRWREEMFPPRLVIIDGEGLGHGGDLKEGLSLEYTKLIPQIDELVWVGTAHHSIGDGTQLILTDLAQRAWIDRLFIAYTRADPNLKLGETPEKLCLRLPRDTNSHIERLVGKTGSSLTS